MFKRSLASLAAVAVFSGVVVAPANAMTVTVNNDKTCTIKLNAEEARLTSLQQTTNLDKEGKAAGIIVSIVEGQLIKLPAEIEKAKKKLATLEPNTTEWAKLTSELKEKEKQLTTYQNLKDALNACFAGENYDSEKPNGPKNPDDSEKPNGPKNPDDSEKPNDPKHPEVERALPSTNGAVIGAIVAVLGILAAALPVIKSILRLSCRKQVLTPGSVVTPPRSQKRMCAGIRAFPVSIGHARGDLKACFPST
ncbi:hypothetical protein ACQX0D_12205 [Corynebacterium diphtheriae]